VVIHVEEADEEVFVAEEYIIIMEAVGEASITIHQMKTSRKLFASIVINLVTRRSTALRNEVKRENKPGMTGSTKTDQLENHLELCPHPSALWPNARPIG
jgi:hypothetical protein